MAVKLIANYSKRLGLPGYSSHQYSISVETEVNTTDDIAFEAEKLYHNLQSNVDAQIQNPGFIAPHDYGMESSPQQANTPQPNNVTPITGAIDLVRQDLVPVDFKTSACKPTPETAAFDHELQLVCYQLMIEKATGKTPPALELLFLVKTKTPQVIPVSIAPANDHRKQRAVKMLETAVQGIAEGRFHPQPGMHCSWCSFRNECSKWKGEAL